MTSGVGFKSNAEAVDDAVMMLTAADGELEPESPVPHVFVVPAPIRSAAKLLKIPGQARISMLGRDNTQFVADDKSVGLRVAHVASTHDRSHEADS